MIMPGGEGFCGRRDAGAALAGEASNQSAHTALPTASGAACVTGGGPPVVLPPTGENQWRPSRPPERGEGDGAQAHHRHTSAHDAEGVEEQGAEQDEQGEG